MFDREKLHDHLLSRILMRYRLVYNAPSYFNDVLSPSNIPISKIDGSFRSLPRHADSNVMITVILSIKV